MYLIRLTNVFCRIKFVINDPSRTRLFSNVVTAVTEKIPAAAPTETDIKIPLHQRWLSFWKLLLKDYKDVIVDSSRRMKQHPYKSSFWLTIFGIVVICNALNPDETNYRESVIRKSNDLIFVSKSVRNPNAELYLQTLESYFNANQIKRISFGIFSLILLNYKCANSALYKDNCSYVQPTYLEILQNNIIDVGFLDQWWNLEKYMVDYDINPNEWTVQ